MFVRVALVLFLFFVLAVPGWTQIPDCNGKKIGDLPNMSNNISGEFIVENEYTFCIRNFFYDGMGHDVYLYLYYPGEDLDGTGGGVIVNIAQPSAPCQFDPSRSSSGETFRFTLPEKKFRACDFGAFTIWSRYTKMLFTSITWESDIFTDGQACTPSPGRGYVGDLASTRVGGDLYVVDNKTFAIRNFIYNGTAPDLFVYWYPPGVFADPKGNGEIIPLTKNNGPEGKFDNTNYTGLPMEDFVIPIPNNMDVFTCDIGTFTIWCREFLLIFTELPLNLQIFTNNPLVPAFEPNRILCNRPSTRPGVLVGQFPTTNAKAISGTIYVRDQWTIEIQLFSFDASKDAFFYYYRVEEEVDNNGGGKEIKKIARTNNLMEKVASYLYNEDVTVNLSLAETGKVKACEIGYFTVYAPNEKKHLTQIKIPQDIFSSDGSDGKIMCDGAQHLAMTYFLAILFSLLAYAPFY